MPEKIKAVALRIKTLREISGESIRDVSMKMNVPEEAYAGFESGKTDIPMSFLYEVANYFKVELTALLTGGEPHMHTYSLVRAGSGPVVERRKEYKYADMAYNFQHKKMEVFEVTVEPEKGGKKARLNSHPGQEYNYCLEGSLKVTLGKNEVIMNKGDSLYFDSAIMHSMEAMDNKPARFLAILL